MSEDYDGIAGSDIKKGDLIKVGDDGLIYPINMGEALESIISESLMQMADRLDADAAKYAAWKGAKPSALHAISTAAHVLRECSAEMDMACTPSGFGMELEKPEGEKPGRTGAQP